MCLARSRPPMTLLPYSNHAVLSSYIRVGFCCDICDIRSFGEQSGRTTGQLGSTGLRPCHRRDGTAVQTLRSFYRSYRSQASALSVTTTGRQRSVGVWTSPPPQEPARLARVDYGPAMQLVDEDRSDAVRWDRRLRDRRERAYASVRTRSTGLGEYCKSTGRGMSWVFIILTSRSFYLGEPGP